MKRLNRLTVMVFLLLIAAYSSAQTQVTIIGKVLAPDGSPAYVTVALKKQGKADTTHASGVFQLVSGVAIADTVVISSVSYQTKLIPIDATVGVVNLGTIYLTYNTNQLQDIEVRGRVSKSYKSDYSFVATKTQSALIDVPQAVSTLTKELIADKMDFTLKDAADDVAGVNNYSGYDDYSIRGFKAENARMINGLRGYNTTYTSSMLVNAERIEVIKGPAAVLYGNCDPGGTINIVTKKPLAEQQSSVAVAAGSWHHYRLQGDLTGPLNNKKTLLYRLNTGYDNSHSFRDAYFGKSYQIAPSLSYIPNDKLQVNADFSLSHINTILDRGQPGFAGDHSLNSTRKSFSVTQPGDYLHESDYASNILFSYKFNQHFSFNSGYLHYITQQNTAEHGVHSYITPDSVNLYFTQWDYHTVTNTFTNYVTYRFSTGAVKHALIGGYDYVRSKVDLEQDYFEDDAFGEDNGIVGTLSLRNPRLLSTPVAKYELSEYESDASDVEASIYKTQGLYLQEQLEWKKWRLLLGFRQELYRADTGGSDEADDEAGKEEDEANVLMPRISLLYKLQPNVSVYGTYNKGFDPFEASTSTQVFDAPFKPVTSELWEAGAKANFFRNQLAATVSLYRLTLHNVAVNANDFSNPNLYIQQGEDRSTGVETEVNGNLLPNLSVSASYAYCIAKVIKSKIAAQEGMAVENAPRNLSSSWIKYRFAKGLFKNFSLAAGHSQAGVRNTLESGLRLPAYVVADAGIRYDYKQFNIALNVHNIFNTDYWIAAYNTVNKWPGAPTHGLLRVEMRF